MKKTFIILFALIALLAVVSCKQDVDPNIYQYDASSYLGAWELDLAKAEGDEDGCIHLMQINFEKDLTYSVVNYYFNAQTNNIHFVEGATGTYTYDSETGDIALTDPTPTVGYNWTEATGLSLLRSGVLYEFARPKYVIKVSKDQAALVGVWEVRDDNTDVGLRRQQYVFNADGTANILYENGLGAYGEAFTKSWQYKDGTEVKDYQVTDSMKWYQGSEMTAVAIVHKQENYFVLETTRTIVNDGTETTYAPGRVCYKYIILDYGSDKLLINITSGVTYVKKSQSDMIDVNKKAGTVVNRWEIFNGDIIVDPNVPPTDLHKQLYLRSDGKFYTNGVNGEILTITGGNPVVYYYGTYSTNLTETDFDGFLDSMKKQCLEMDPDTYESYTEEQWKTWRENYKALLFDEDKATYEIYKGTLTLDPEYGEAEVFEITVGIATEKYGLDIPNGEPVVSYSILFRKAEGIYRWLNDEIN